MKLIKALTFLMMVILLWACNSTRIRSSWKAEQTVAKPFHNIMIWGIIPIDDSTVRRQIENHLVNDLASKGYHAVSSMEVYESKAFNKLTDQAIVDQYRSTGVDAVITLVLLQKEQAEQYYPAGILDQPLNSSNIDRYANTMYEKVFTPGYYISTTSYFWEANLFDVADNRLTYSVRTNSFDPQSTEKLAHENGLIIIKDLLKKKVIPDLSPKKE